MEFSRKAQSDIGEDLFGSGRSNSKQAIAVKHWSCKSQFKRCKIFIEISISSFQKRKCSPNLAGQLLPGLHLKRSPTDNNLFRIDKAPS
ncbi:hypothetical protein CEXT_446711 [Caerostris extrusa]|uniref:Ycf15 n=1 Tax=Caerostris extrusa TaxID=172846 RepID=A0AAV4REZ9_CAEEX|nr:hypothetical protein CEXT_446711 [Caerostris extrusa]